MIHLALLSALVSYNVYTLNHSVVWFVGVLLYRAGRHIEPALRDPVINERGC